MQTFFFCFHCKNKHSKMIYSFLHFSLNRLKDVDQREKKSEGEGEGLSFPFRSLKFMYLKLKKKQHV